MGKDNKAEMTETPHDAAADPQQTIAELQRNLNERTAERDESLTYQTAISNVLNVISRSPSDIQPVLDTIAETAQQLCESEHAYIFRFDGDKYHLVAARDVRAERIAFLKDNPIVPNRGSTVGRVALERRPVHVMDALADNEYKLSLVGHGGRTILGVPLLRDGIAIGVIVLTRGVVRPFVERQIQLVSTFADQALIAIENVRLFNETREALEQQTATAEVLSVISSSAGDLAPVFDAMLGKAMQLCGANFGVLNTFDGNVFHTAATYGLPPAYDGYRRKQPLDYGPGTAPARLLHGEPFVEINDLCDSDAYRNGEPNRRALVDIGRARSLLAVPLLNDERVVGNVMIFRQEPARFSERQIALLKQFAAQAVIAIENTRLLRDLRASTEDLSESLQQQTATADVLKVISRSAFDLQAVLETLVRSAVQLSSAHRGVIFLRDGDVFSFRAASYADISPAWLEWLKDNPHQASRRTLVGRAIASAQTVCIPDFLTDPELGARTPGNDIGGIRAGLAVPLLRNGQVEGVMALSRPAPGPFLKRQIELVETFADQAVIAIENARLFDEVQARTRDLTESLQQQIATADVLKVISRSAFDLEMVMNTLASSAAELCDADRGALFLREDDFLVLRGRSEMDQKLTDSLRKAPVQIDSETHMGRAVLNGTVANIADFENDPNTRLRTFQRAFGFKSFLAVPLMREGRSVGVFTLTRSQVGAFSQRQIDLVQTFADQAVIAIENVRLFDEVQARTKELAASLDDLRTAQDRLVQTEKLASLGQLTAGIAHEIKNPLNFINNFAALSAELVGEMNDVLAQATVDKKTRDELDELAHMLKANLEKVVQHGKRADSIVKNMLLHSREGSGEHRPTDINALVDESLNLAYHGARAEKSAFEITIQRDFDPAAGMSVVYPQEITRVLLNLISNGLYATNKRSQETGGAFKPMLYAATKNLGDKVEIRIRDNGTGIPEDVKEKIFNPFFTTKPAGEGTGLGLSMSHDIVVKQHGGKIDVVSELGVFTEFIVMLPRA
jgi:two-component system NtrC family sensor kinase